MEGRRGKGRRGEGMNPEPFHRSPRGYTTERNYDVKKKRNVMKNSKTGYGGSKGNIIRKENYEKVKML